MISIEDRIKFYYGHDEYGLIEPSSLNTVIFDKPFHSNQYYNTLGAYVLDIDRYIKYLPNRKNKLWFQCGDRWYNGSPFPVLVKTRNTKAKNCSGIIANLNSIRHWSAVEKVINDNPLWHSKISNVVWRGSTTGAKDQNIRESVVKKYFHKYDIGFSYISKQRNHLSKYAQNSMSLKELLKYKYILVLDGNDKASCLNWVLASNSVPIMKKPIFHSWLCEPWLKSGVHYVEMNQDGSNLEEVIDWCKNNDEECKKIAENGKLFIKQNFMNQTVEKSIEKKLVQKIIKHMAQCK